MECGEKIATWYKLMSNVNTIVSAGSFEDDW